MALGLTDGSNNYGTGTQNSYYTIGTLIGAKTNYSKNAATTGGGNGEIAGNSIIGITNDVTKSGLVCEADNNIKIIIKY